MKVPEKVRDAVMRRDYWCCARCGRDVTSSPYSVHHRKPRGAGGTQDARSIDLRNLVLLCGSGVSGCHGHIESHRAEAYETRWLLRSYYDLPQPILRPDGARLLLTAEGARITQTWNDAQREEDAS